MPTRCSGHLSHSQHLGHREVGMRLLGYAMGGSHSPEHGRAVWNGLRRLSIGTVLDRQGCMSHGIKIQTSVRFKNSGTGKWRLPDTVKECCITMSYGREILWVTLRSLLVAQSVTDSKIYIFFWKYSLKTIKHIYDVGHHVHIKSVHYIYVNRHVYIVFFTTAVFNGKLSNFYFIISLLFNFILW